MSVVILSVDIAGIAETEFTTDELKSKKLTESTQAGLNAAQERRIVPGGEKSVNHVKNNPGIQNLLPFVQILSGRDKSSSGYEQARRH